MRSGVRSWQEQASSAFAWVADVYQQAEVLLKDAEALFKNEGWQIRYGDGWGGAAMSQWDLAGWPFIYLKSLAASPTADAWKATTGKVVLFGVLFHGARGADRTGPRYFGAVAEWTEPKVPCNHWMLYDALDCDSAEERQFVTTGEAIRCSKPRNDSRLYGGLVQVTWFDVPLAAISSAAALADVVGSTRMLLLDGTVDVSRLLSRLDDLAPAPGDANG